MPTVDAQTNSLETALENQETIRVIIGLNIPVFATAGELQENELESQKNLIKEIQFSLLDEVGLPLASPQEGLQASFDNSSVLFNYIPYMILTVDKETLKKLEDSEQVSTIIQEGFLEPLLARSTPVIGATDAWNAGYAGQGKTIAILDSGIDKMHPMLIDKVVSEACYSTTAGIITSVCPDGNTQQIGDGAANYCSVSKCDHGTHVAGIAAGNTVFSGPVVSYSGVAKEANIIAIQVFSRVDSFSACKSSPTCISALDGDVIRGLERVMDLRDIFDITSVNLSLGRDYNSSTCDNSPYKEIIDQLRSVGIATIVASGNDFWKDGIRNPACVSSAISVGSTTNNDIVSGFSNSAAFLDFLAPGEDIRSAIAGGHQLGYKGGTSMAAPHVTGAWAVLKQHSPQSSVQQIFDSLKNTGIDVVDTNGLSFKRIQLDSALNYLGPIISDPPGAPTSLIATAISSSEIDLIWNAPNDDKNSIIGYRIDRESPIGVGFSVIENNTNSKLTSFHDSGLDSDLMYSYKVFAINSVGIGDPSNLASDKTKPIVPRGDFTISSEPSGIEDMQINSSKQVIVTINSINGFNGKIDLIEHSSSNNISVSLSESSVTLDNSNPKVVITLDIDSKNISGNYETTITAKNDSLVHAITIPVTIKTTNGGGCLIATAAFGSELAPQVQLLRELRDNKLLNTESGTSFMESFNQVYYSFSPIIADYERENPVFKEAVKLAITPMISSLSILNYVDISSDQEVLGYGISLILLNIGIYFVAPVIVIFEIRKRF